MVATTRLKWSLLALAPYPVLLLQGSGSAPARVLYDRDVAPLMKAHCVSCHGEKNPAAGLRLDTPEGVLRAVKQGDGAHSGLIRRMRGLDGKPAMPMGFPSLPKDKVDLLAAWVDQGAHTEAPKTIFVRDVQPILKARCGTCHSGASPAAGLDLTEPKALMRAIAKGDPDHSPLMRRLMGLDGKPRMPQGFAPLPAAELAKIRDWIGEGAYLDGGEARHWAYVPPVRPPLPKVRNAAWVRNPIDAFVLARLEKEGLKPSPEADRATLLRRLSLDLIGVPPTPAELDAFLADRRPDAYERQVDRLLASPHYGERMAGRWLDLARYADSDGYEKDLNRTAWVYRDWVIDAYNHNLPYDQFVVQQIAGDELPNATLADRVATGFSRNSMMNREGGVDQAEAHFEVVLDRVATTSTVFMGSTLACARCHDHKYDPFTQRDFYRMAAFFSNDVVTPRGDASVSESKWEEPEIRVPSPDQVAQLPQLRTELKSVTSLPLGANVPAATWTPLKPAKVSAEKARLLVDPSGAVVASEANASTELYRVETDAPDKAMTALRLEPTGGRGGGGNFVLTGVQVWADGVEQPLAGASADFVQDGFDPAGAVAGDRDSGWAVHPQTNRVHAMVLSFAHPIHAKRLEISLATRSKYVGHNLGFFRLAATDAAEPHAEHHLSLSEARKGVLQARIAKIEHNAPSALVLQEKPGTAVPKEWIHTRGEFLSRAEEVAAGTPAFLPSLPSGVRPSRLALGRWLVAKDNPLTARVEANRLWEGLFGTGLVETSEDFGTQGTPPTHPELLDWLAVRLRDGGWNVKDAVRLIVTSATYRQTSAATPELLRRDPSDHLLARFPRVRLEAETIRDNALAVSGLLSPKIGGPSVMPDQPEGVWDTPYSGENWTRSEGEDRWRRGMYTMWKRSAPYPAFIAFDATSRETCTVRRIRTDTPLQALALLNDPAMIAAAQALGDRMILEGGKDPLGYGFRLATGRTATAAERARLAALKASLARRYVARPAEAAKLGGWEKATRTMVANVLLNLDETITKE